MRRYSSYAWLVFLLAISAPVRGGGGDRPPPGKPRFREFMGLCGHTVAFNPRRYEPVCRAVRDYHPLDWDTGDDPGSPTRFPSARNGVAWDQVYGSWKAAGYETDACVMFDNLPAKSWKDIPKDSFAYGRAFAKAFGPSSPSKLVASVEVGNEPGKYDDESYRALFRNMARGLREGDPKLKVGTCALTTGESGQYAKSVRCVQGSEEFYDFLNVHTYAEAEGYPTWRRSYPEDPKTDYLASVRRLIAWRDRHAPGKEVRVTEFGWDASTKPAPASGTFSKWVGSTETEQARYLVRSFLLFSALDVTRAYVFFFDDKDEPQVHGSSGLTRDGKPKPAFHALAHLLRTLGEYRFLRVVGGQQEHAFVYEFVHGDDPGRRIWAVWSPTGTGQKGRISLKTEGMELLGAEAMPLSKDEAQADRPVVRDGLVTLAFGESPVFLLWRANIPAK